MKRANARIWGEVVIGFSFLTMVYIYFSPLLDSAISSGRNALSSGSPFFLFYEWANNVVMRFVFMMMVFGCFWAIASFKYDQRMKGES